MAISLINPTRLTVLEAVNSVLQAVGERQVNRLKETVQASKVEALLGRISTEVQTEGWTFCTDTNQLFIPTTDGTINLPANILSFRLTDDSYDLDLVRRSGKLYNRATNSFVFSDPLRLDIVTPLPFDDLPQSAAWYITLRASVEFMSAEYPNNPAIGNLRGKLAEALRSLEQFDASLRPGTLKNKSPHFARMRGNRRRRSI